MPKKSRKSKPAPRRRSFLGHLFWLGFRLGVVVVLVWTVIAMGFYAWALTFDLKVIHNMPERSVVYDKDGRLYSRLAGENRVVVPFDKVSNDFVNALLAREDTRFYSHHGIDPIGIARAIVRNFIGGGFRQGASTITQQLARNSFPLGGKNMFRKLIEAALAYRIETELSKEEILEAYMNRIYFGSGYYGVETASQAYFGKPASRMSLSDAALLAGLIRSPNRFSPFNDLKAAQRERDTVLKRMAETGFIDNERMEAVVATRPVIAEKTMSYREDNWAMDTILKELDLAIDRDQFDEGGLKIYSTIDGALQSAAETSVRRRMEAVEELRGYPHKPMSAFSAQDVAQAASVPYVEAAAIAIDNRTGGISAIVGGRDYERSKFNRAILGHRQIGSSIKPFVYAKAFEKGLGVNDPIDDNRLHPGELPRKYGRYDPSNSDGTYRGIMPAKDGLVLSRNTMTVRVGLRAGFDDIADTVVLAGLSQNPPRLPALCLGAFETNLKDLTASYTVFSTGGSKLQPYLIDHITDASGRTIFKATHGKIQVLSPQAAQLTGSVMEEVLARGTGARARALGLRHRAAGKTGTTNDFMDAWFIGYDSHITCGVWVGFDQPRKIMPGGYGAELALPIWVDIVEGGR